MRAWRMKWKILAVAATVAVVAAVVVWAVADRGQRPAAQATSATPRSLTGTTLDGAHFDLASYRGRPVVINFFARWCPPCNEEAPALAAFARAHPNAAFVGIDVNDKLAGGVAFVRKYGLPFAVVSDAHGAIASAYGVTGIPTTFFLDRRGEVRDVLEGASTRQSFEDGLKKAS